MECYPPILKVLVLTTPLIMSVPTTGWAQTISSQRTTEATDWSRYMDVEMLDALKEQTPDLQIIDIRKDKYMSQGVIPGAVWMPYGEWRGPENRQGQMLTELELEEFLSDNGLDPELPIVVHNHSDHIVQTGRAAFVYWILKSSGFEDIAILEGGINAWNAADLPLAENPTVLPPTMVNLTYQTDWWADPMDIFAVTSGQVDGAILDARLDGQVRRSVETGEPMMSMPMAQYVPSSFFTNDLDAANLSEEALNQFRAKLEDRGLDLGDGMLISVCQTGELSAVSWFYASEVVGIENVRYYPDALAGWEGDGGVMFGLDTTVDQ